MVWPLKPRSEKALPREDTPAVLLRALEQYPYQTLKTGEVFRLADSTLREERPEFYLSSQAIRITLRDLANAPEPRVYVRHADQRDPDDLTRNATSPVLLWSLNPEIPVWDPELGDKIGAMPKPRLNPDHRPTRSTGRKPKRQAAAGDQRVRSSNRAELIVSLVRELAVDADSSRDSRELQREVERLTALLDKTIQERNEATKQLRTITRAQRTIQEALGLIEKR